jgi:signal transduction histidine kinase
VFVLAGLGTPEQKLWTSNLMSPIITFAAAGLAFLAGWQRQSDTRTRLAWTLFGLAFLSNGLGSTAWFVYESIMQTYPIVSWSDVGWLGFYPLLLAAVMVFPTAPYRRHDQITFWLDAVTVMLGGGMLIWYFSVGPRASNIITDPLVTAVTFGYPIGDLVALFAITTIALSRIDLRSILPIRLIGIGLLINLVTNLGYSWMLFTGTYQTGLWPSAGWCLAFGACALAAGFHLVDSAKLQTTTVPPATQRGSLNIVPYIGIGVGLLLVVGVAITNWSSPISELVLAATTLTIIVIIRQVVAIRENVRLLAERDAATQASQLKTEFLANMSHELRTPLNSIINFTRIVSSGMRGPVTPEQVDYLDRVRQSGEHLLGLINDILDLSKIEAGRMELIREAVDLAELIPSVMGLPKINQSNYTRNSTRACRR